MKGAATLRRISLRHFGLKAFLLGLLLSAALFLPVIIENNGIFMYYGDFNAQEIPFYQLMHDEVLRGNFGWSNLTDLGTANMSSYAFYLIASPFFYLTLPFPSEAVPYLMGPLFMLKFAFCSLAAYLYLRRYVKDPVYAVAGGLMYAFSGFSIYNIFFFHFHEPMIFFPLLLAAVDSFMYDGRRGIVAPAVFAACIVNYYFFAGMAVFTALYWLMLVFSGAYKLKATAVILFFAEVLIGFLASAFLLLPVALFISGNPRLEELPDGYGALVHDPPQKYWYIILSFFFPPELAAQPNFAPESSCKWASVSGWIPLAGMTGVIGYLQLKKRDWLKRFILLLALMALVPVLNSMFQLLNSSIYYARWFYMFVLILILATLKSLESSEVNWRRAIGWSTGITAFIAVAIAVIPHTTTDDNDVTTFTVGLYKYNERFFIYTAAAMVSVLAFALIVTYFSHKSRRRAALTLAGVCVITLMTSTYIVQTANTLDADEKAFLRTNAVNMGSNLEIDDIKDVRSDFYECPENLSMFYRIPSINTFHSVVPPSIMDFYDKVGIKRDVASRPSTDNYGLRGLFSCKYLFDANYDEESFTEDDGKKKMPGWKYLKTVNGCRVFENSNYVPMGFMYDSFLTEKEFEGVGKQYRTEAILKSMVLSGEDAVKYGSITGYTKKDLKDMKKPSKTGFRSKSSDYRFGRYEYFSDCEKLKKNACDSFEYTDEGFKATVNNKGKDNLVFFSVPFDRGWSAQVNGKDAEIIKSNIGFMSVEVPAESENEIVFKYYPYGFRTGIIITVVCGILFFMYLIMLLIVRKRILNR